MIEPAIEVIGLSKSYQLYGSPFGRLLERMPWNARQRHTAVHALRDVNFQVQPGSCMGLVGGNGAGKSTLLKILTGTTFPSVGGYRIRGRISSLLELGAGFHAEFSGRENIFMNAAMMGFSRKEMKAKFHEILEFSELHGFIDAPIRTYSSGMVCRLGFSVAVATDPDVLIIDEILAVGDMHFQRKCVERIWDYKNRGKTMFFCSHSLYDVRQICDRAIWLKDGHIERIGDAVMVTNDYATYENQLGAKADFRVEEKPPQSPDHPRILAVDLLDARTGKERNVFQPGDHVAVRVRIKNGAKPERVHVAIGATRKEGMMLFAHSTQFDGVEIDFAEGHVVLELPNLRLLAGELVVPVWLLDARGVHRFHEMPASKNLIVENHASKDLGVVLHDHSWRVQPHSAASACR
jgi:ABC-type polysaccharide/polyol phosphate transport system ATPase subunit